MCKYDKLSFKRDAGDCYSGLESEQLFSFVFINQLPSVPLYFTDKWEDLHIPHTELPAQQHVFTKNKQRNKQKNPTIPLKLC